LQACKEQGIVARAHPSVASAIIVNEHTHIPSCPGYEEGWFYVQDAGAQMAATLLPVQQGGRVLDACAGVGGKTTHLATLHQYQSIVALDSNKEHFERLQQNIDRLKCQPVTVVHAALEDYKDPEGFDAILLDAPCSATGTIARHPEIKVIRKPGDHPDQSLLLKAAWGLLKPGGYLLYTTCSILASENEDIIATLDTPWSEIPLSFGHKRRYGVQLLPKECWNGFYYCLLQKP
jgi:16S rRNA (cytosine967-C5)-methyltransferase